MIIKDFYKTRGDGVELYRTYSDAGYIIRKIGTEEEYEEAIDVATTDYKYEETEQKIPNREENSETSDSWELEAEASYLKGVNEA